MKLLPPTRLSWENVTRQELLLPAPDADMATEPLFAIEAAPFDAFWKRVEAAWGGRSFVDALLDAMVARGLLWKHWYRQMTAMGLGTSPHLHVNPQELFYCVSTYALGSLCQSQQLRLTLCASHVCPCV